MEQNKSVRKAIAKFAEETSTHGIGFILGGRSRTLRLIWLVLLLSSTGFFIYQIQKLLTAYYLRPTLISVEKREDREMNFPSITICKGSTLSRSGGIKDHIFLSHPSLKHYYLTEYSLLALRAFLAQEYMRYLLKLDDVKKASGDPRSFFLTKVDSSCIFGIHDYCKYPRNISDVLTTSYGGLCYQFNKNGNLIQRDAGSYYGLSMILFVNQSDYVPFTTFDFGSGILVKIGDAGEHPFPEIDGLPVSPGFLTRISLKKVVYERLGAPYPSNCTDGKNINILYPGKYTLTNCKRSCLVRDSLKKCGSTDPLTLMLLNHTGKYEYKPINASTLSCIFNSAATSTSEDRKECTCPVPCKEVEYIPTISQTKWPSQSDLPFYKQTFAYALGMKVSDLTDDFVYNNFLQLNIYFDEMSYQDVREKKEWTVEKLISDIGGQMGVWIGASILSLFEILFLFVDIFRALYSKRNKRKKSIIPTWRVAVKDGGGC